MDATLLTALSTVLAKLCKASGPLAPGSYNVDETLTIRLAGTVLKAEDETYIPTVDIPLKRTMALLLARMGVQRDAAMAALVAAMSDALNADRNADGDIDAYMKDVDAAMARVQSVTAALPPKTRTGKTRVDATLAVAPAGTLTVSIP